MIDTIYSDPNFLEHHGVKGMKWGVRRYQNEDGSLTSEGKKRLATAFKTKSLDAYNRAADKQNNGRIDEFNTNFEKKHNLSGKKDWGLGDYFETDLGQEYIKEYNTLWKNTYKEAITEEFGLDEIKDGEKWCNYFINNYEFGFYNELDDFILK